MSADRRPRSIVISYGTATFDVKLSFGSGNRLKIDVHPDLRVTAVAPVDQPWERVHARLRAKASWVVKQLRYFEQFRPPPPRRGYISGESFLYLGRQYRLRIREAETAQVRLVGPHLLVDTPERSAASVRVLVQRWYRARAGIVLRQRLESCAALTSSLGLPTPEMRLRRMKTRWGSCNAHGGIVLHPDLVMVPRQCVDYVIVHELCHRRILRHDAAFYRLLSRYIPDWKSRKARLEHFLIGEH